MSSSSKTYRIYAFDAQRLSVTTDSIEAASDAEAIATIQAAGFGSKCEIWQERRLVAQLVAEPETPQASFGGSAMDGGSEIFAC